MNQHQIMIRIVESAHYFIDNVSTVRKTAKAFNISKSQMHIDLSIHLKNIDKDLYYAVRKILNKNKQERHLRGGLATKRKYYLLRTSK